VTIADVSHDVGVDGCPLCSRQLPQVALKQVLALELLEYIEDWIGDCESSLQEADFAQLPL
jgi:hypothetical protein